LFGFVKEPVDLSLNSFAGHSAAIIAPAGRRVKEKADTDRSR